jgi:hypothetical protein
MKTYSTPLVISNGTAVGATMAPPVPPSTEIMLHFNAAGAVGFGL